MRNKRFILSLILCAMTISLAAQNEVLTLDSCLRAARQRNCTIQAARLDVLISQEVKKQMLWKYFPQVSLQGFAFGAARHLIEFDVREMSNSADMKDFLSQVFDLIHEQDTSVNPVVKKMRWGVSAQAQAVQPIYWGGQIVTANKLAKLGIDASELKAEVSERDVLQEVAETYWLVAGLMEKRTTIQIATDLLDSIGDVANTAYNNGIVTKNDLLRVQLKQNEMQTKAMQLENGIQLASRFLCHMIGQPYNGEIILETFEENEPMAELAPKPDSIRIDGRPETKLLETNVRYNQLMKRLTLGESLPHLALGISGGYTNFFERDKWNALAILSLSIPLTQWGETTHKLRQHDLQIRQAQLMQSDLREKLNLQNTQIYDQMVESLKMLEQHRTGRDLAKENYRVALMNYKAGVGTMTELMEAEALLLMAENAYTDAQISYRVAARKFADFNK